MGLKTCTSFLPFSHRDIPDSSGIRGYVYAMSNRYFPGLMKLGFSNRSPIERMKELDRQTANPGSFVPELWFVTLEAPAHEKRLFEALDPWRNQPGKEFLKIDVLTLALYLAWYFERDPDFIQPNLRAAFQQLKSGLEVGEIPK